MRGLPLVRTLSLGLILGALLGAFAGLLECLFAPLETFWRWPYSLGANGLFGATWGLAAAFAAAATPSARRGDLPGATGNLVAVASLPLFAAGLGLLVNRVFLSGIHFLDPRSLAADAVALLSAVALSYALGRGIAAAARAGGFERAPGPLAAGIVLALLGFGTLLPGWTLPRGTADPDRPDIVLVSIDTLRPDGLSGGGSPLPTSPELDRLAREGILWPEALAASPGSAASHAALLTSRYPVSNGVWSNFTVMDRSVTTLTEILREEGYRTGGFVTNTFLGRRFHFDQAFDSYVESGMVERLEEPSRSSLWRSLGLVQIVDRVRGRLDPGYDPSFDTALGWIGETDRPSFFFVHLMDVHSPYVPPALWAKRFGADPDRGYPPRNGWGWLASVEAYTGEIAFADRKIGRLRRTLERHERFRDAIVIITSDHGENLLDHEPNFSHGRTLFDATLRIVASLRAPAHGVSTRVEGTPIENVDLLPTLFSILGWEGDDDWEGRSYWPEAPPERASFSQLNRDFSIRTRTSKLVLREDGGRDWYRLDEDPGERRVSSLPPREQRELEIALEHWMAQHATELYDRAVSVDPGDMSPELRAKLQALGYLDD